MKAVKKCPPSVFLGWAAVKKIPEVETMFKLLTKNELFFMLIEAVLLAAGSSPAVSRWLPAGSHTAP